MAPSSLVDSSRKDGIRHPQMTPSTPPSSSFSRRRHEKDAMKRRIRRFSSKFKMALSSMKNGIASPIDGHCRSPMDVNGCQRTSTDVNSPSRRRHETHEAPRFEIQDGDPLRIQDGAFLPDDRQYSAPLKMDVNASSSCPLSSFLPHSCLLTVTMPEQI